MTTTLPVRVMVEDAWDQVLLQLPETALLSELKRQALQRTHVDGDPGAFAVKFRGAELFDESRTLSDAGVVRNAQLIVLSRRRRPVR
jgi:hypothetical protein